MHVLCVVNYSATTEIDTYAHPLSLHDALPIYKRGRKAISIAINREAIVERIMNGVAVPAGELLPQGFFGTTPGAEAEKYDPEGAKKLLAEAGYPDGFGLTLG